MSTAAAPLAPDLLRRVIRLQVLTIAWMTVEAIVAVGAAWMARGLALLGFDGDSAIELFSAIIVFWRFRSKSDSGEAEKLAARVAGGLLFIVAASGRNLCDCQRQTSQERTSGSDNFRFAVARPRSDFQLGKHPRSGSAVS